MAFTAEISRTNPTCLLFLVDQSKSMDGPFGGQPGKKKSEGVADAINRLLQNLVLKCAKSTGVRDYFHVGVIGYGAEVKPVLTGTSAARPLLLCHDHCTRCRPSLWPRRFATRRSWFSRATT